ncbi:Hpt domain-containing protein [Psychrosphaera haliotis]|uniref:Hpt domain-containing protein n=1 Tax=Psychrosphaera haliotis TaxID=555083 RepID=UPI00236DBAE2|nr:Hpt domain-containing protein [Psychrosphaera haliotis]
MTIAALQSIDGLDLKTGLTNCMDDEQLYKDVISMFVIQLDQDIPMVRQFYNTQDWIGLGKACHGIKGAAASVGAHKVQDASAELEKAGKENNGDVINSQFEQYIVLLESFKAQISAAI